MMYLYSLLAAVLLIVAIFITPVKHKVWVATGIIAAAAMAAFGIAITVFSRGTEMTIAEFSTPIFGAEHFSVDMLSSLFLVIISIASLATVLYSRGYVAGYLKTLSPAHISLHYTALVLLVVSMMLVVTSSGGFSFLFTWELMTIASFILILFEALYNLIDSSTLLLVDILQVVGDTGKLGTAYLETALLKVLLNLRE